MVHQVGLQEHDQAEKLQEGMLQRLVHGAVQVQLQDVQPMVGVVVNLVVVLGLVPVDRVPIF